MCRLEWFDEVYRRHPKPDHIARLGGHGYRVVIVVEDAEGHEADEMGEGGKGVLHYAVVNDSHRRTVEATLVTKATMGALAFSDPGTGALTASVTCKITAHRKCRVEDPPAPFQDSVEIEVQSIRRPQEVFLTELTTEEEDPRKRVVKREVHDDPLTNTVLIKRGRSQNKPKVPAIIKSKEGGSSTPELDGGLYKQLNEALIAAFPTQPDLEMMLRFKLNVILANIVTPSDDQPTAVFKLIGKAHAEGWLDKLILAACQTNPRNPKLLELSQKLNLPPLNPNVMD